MKREEVLGRLNVLINGKSFFWLNSLPFKWKGDFFHQKNQNGPNQFWFQKVLLTQIHKTYKVCILYRFKTKEKHQFSWKKSSICFLLFFSSENLHFWIFQTRRKWSGSWYRYLVCCSASHRTSRFFQGLFRSSFQGPRNYGTDCCPRSLCTGYETQVLWNWSNQKRKDSKKEEKKQQWKFANEKK